MLQVNMNHLFFLVLMGPRTAMVNIYMVTRACRFPFLKILL
uniref:Uncharacterized protein n=1 Tax=Zea mays TaxID=4577 RepID=C4J237_MAIZE|nr:unknown [Zea mays]ACR37101.1 unknown [Zea mays]